MNWRNTSAYLARLIGAGERNIEGILLLLFGTMATGVMGSALYGVLTIWLGETPPVLLILIAVSLLLLIFAAAGLSAVIERFRSGNTVPMSESDEFLPNRGLVLLVSTGRNKSNDPALDRHVRPVAGNKLERCWLVQTTQSQLEATNLVAKYQDRVKINPPASVNDAYSLRAAFYIVRSIIDRALADGFDVSDLIVDITGGTKVMTAGAALACNERHVAIQYMKPEHDPITGNVIEGVPPTPVKVNLSEIFGEEDQEDVSSQPTTPAEAPPVGVAPAKERSAERRQAFG